MDFVKSEDYSVLARKEIKKILLEEDPASKLSAAGQMAIHQIKNYLYGRYDTGQIFSAEGNERNAHIVMIVIDCTIYHLYTSVCPDRIPELRSQRYEDALDWLKRVAQGKAQADLPRRKDEKGKEVIGMKITSKYPPRNQRW